jgi:cytochrome c-type biogenesis protein CcmH/NrfG
VYWGRAEELLTEAREAGLQDPTVEVALARLAARSGRGDALAYAEGALADPALVGYDRCTALYLIAEAQVQQGRYKEARPLVRELIRLRRHPRDWLLLSECEGRLGNENATVDALTTAVRISPRLWAVHQHLADLFTRRGDAERAGWHRRRAVP